MNTAFVSTAVTLAVMCLSSWLMRTLSDRMLESVYLQALCYSAQLLALHLLFVAACFWCYRANPAEAWYNGLLAMTIFKIAWNMFKTGSSMLLISGMDAPWEPSSQILFFWLPDTRSSPSPSRVQLL